MKHATCKVLLTLFPLLAGMSSLNAQIAFQGGNILPGTKTCFQANVSLNQPVTPLINPLTGPFPGTFLSDVCIDIQTSHPWTLEVSLVSPNGTVLILSSFNGAGGSNYTGTCFYDGTNNPITGGTAPFTGYFTPQQNPPGFSAFYGQGPNGIWQLCVKDTLTDTTSITPGGPGFGATSVGSGTIAFGIACPPCNLGNAFPFVTICPGESLSLDTLIPMGWTYSTVSYYDSNFNQLSGPVVSAPGVYYIQLQDGCNPFSCMGSVEVTLAHAPVPVLGPDTTINLCPGMVADLNALFVQSGLQASWTHNGIPVSTGMTSSASLPGAYQLIAENGAGCRDTSVVTVNVFPGVALGPDQAVIQCGLQAYDLTALFGTSGLTATWFVNGGVVPNPSAVLNSGSYMLVAEDSNGCSDTAMVVLNLSAPPNLGPDQSMGLCPGTTADLTSLFTLNGLNTTWSLNGALLPNVTSVTSPGTYQLLAQNNAGCEDTAYVNITLYSGITLGFDTTISLCTVQPFDLTGLYTTSGYTTNWFYNGSPFGSPGMATLSGIYALVATDSNGCTDTALVDLDLTVPPWLGPDQSANACTGTAVNLTLLFSTAGMNTSWYLNGLPVAVPAGVTAAGIYTLIVVNQGGCSDTAMVSVSFTNPPVLAAGQSVNFCADATVDLTSLYNTTGLTANWTFLNTPVFNPSGVSAPGVYQLVVLNAGGCSDTALVVLDTLAVPYLGPDQNVVLCPGESVDLTSLFNTAGLSVSWTLSGIPVPNPSVVNMAGSYLLVATNSSGCDDVALVQVTTVSSPVAGPDLQLSVCDGNSIDLTSVYNISGLVASWSLNGVSVMNPAAITVAGQYLLTVSNGWGCTSEAQVTVVINPVPVLGPDKQVTFCAGSSFDLRSLYPLNGLEDQWSLNGIPVPDPGQVMSPGRYRLVAATDSGCTDTAYVMVIVYDNPSLGPDLTFDLCDWNTVDLSSLYDTGGLMASWTWNGDPVLPTVTRDSGWYQLVVTDSNGCTDEAIVVVKNRECLCEAGFTWEGQCMQDPVRLMMHADSAILDVHWFFGNSLIGDAHGQEIVVAFPHDEPVAVRMEATLSCGVSVVEGFVDLEDCSDKCRLFIPSAFTPNRDGMNERFGTYTDCIPVLYRMEIRNRFGQAVFATEHFGESWDGSHGSDPSPEDVYVYHVVCKLPYQEKRVYSGTVALVR